MPLIQHPTDYIGFRNVVVFILCTTETSHTRSIKVSVNIHLKEDKTAYMTLTTAVKKIKTAARETFTVFLSTTIYAKKTACNV